MLDKKYRYKIEKTPQPWDTALMVYNYYVFSEFGALQLHVSEYKSGDGIARSFGLERHYNYRPSYMERGTAPSHKHCWLLEAPCWHDGSSLWAEEVFMSFFIGGDYANRDMDILYRLSDEVYVLEPKENENDV